MINFLGIRSFLYQRILEKLPKLRFTRLFAYIVVVAGIASGVVTYLVFAHSEFFGTGSKAAVLLLNIDLIILLLLGVVIARRLVKLWVERKKGLAGAKLHVRLVVAFSLLTAVPASMVALFSGVFFNVGVQTWFNNRVRTALDESFVVAKAYLEEHKKVISANVLAMAADVGHQFSLLANNPELFNQFLDLQIDVRSLNEAIIFTSNHQILARSRLTFALEFEVIDEYEMSKANKEVVIQTNKNGDRVRALVRIDPSIDAYLMVGRLVDPVVSQKIKMVESAVGEYHQLEHKLAEIEVRFLIIFIIISLLLLLIAIWVALLFATRLVKPIRNLITAAERVRSGDLSARVVEPQSEDEFFLLTHEFNRMTSRLQGHQKRLMAANKQLDDRRQFIEDILAGVTAGVLALSHQKVIRITNRSAAELLGVTTKDIVGKKIEKIVPEIAPILRQVDTSDNKFLQSQINIERQGFSRVLLVRIVIEEGDAGYIVTFDDVTELLSAQRKAAWADVARRVAHEIKNPLTPIQLSAERLRRKYASLIKEDNDSFETYIDTIIRQVNHIGRMANEFSAFARMPNPEMSQENMVSLCNEAVFFQQAAHSDINIQFITKEKELLFLCDASQINQVLTNLLQNAIDSLENSREKSDGTSFAPMVKVILEKKEKVFNIIVEDNGEGFPLQGRDQLTEPYVTRKVKGTGLGLAIVKKIVEDHKGSIALEDREGGGARVRLVFPFE
jgi:two-component system nitrogen regulation sensor histidine kinase NtrY